MTGKNGHLGVPLLFSGETGILSCQSNQYPDEKYTWRLQWKLICVYHSSEPQLILKQELLEKYKEIYGYQDFISIATDLISIDLKNNLSLESIITV